MDTDVSSFFQPLYEHFQAVFSQLIAQLGSFRVVVAKVRSCVVLLLPTPRTNISPNSL